MKAGLSLVRQTLRQFPPGGFVLDKVAIVVIVGCQCNLPLVRDSHTVVRQCQLVRRVHNVLVHREG
jgi:hypothetical protein